MNNEIKLSGGNYGGYVVVAEVATLQDQEGEVLDVISEGVVSSGDTITVNGWVYTVTGDEAVFSGME